MSDSGIKVLLVEDEPAMQVLFGFSLKKEGYTVVKALNGVEGLRQIEETKPDAIISDIMMPEMDGFTFREEILKNPEWAEIPFLFLTAFDNEDNILRGLSLGADDFIPKTDGAKVVSIKLNNALRKRAEIKKKIVGEMDEASKATGVLLKPPKPPKLSGFHIDHYQKTPEDIPGGDFIDYIQAKDTLLIVLGDVMGKKWKAWVFAHAYAGYIRSSIRSITGDLDAVISPAEVLRRLNKAIYRDDQVGESICALSLIAINTSQATATISNALQYPILHLTSNSGSIQKIQTENPLLGLRPDSVFQEIVIQINSGDKLIAATDGITEAKKANGEQIDFEQLIKVFELEFNATKNINPERLVQAIFEASGSSKLTDDATLVLVSAD